MRCYVEVGHWELKQSWGFTPTKQTRERPPSLLLLEDAARKVKMQEPELPLQTESAQLLDLGRPGF